MLKLSFLLTSALLVLPSVVMAAEDAYSDGAESKGGLPQFDPTWFASQVFWLAISFAVLYVIFAKKTLPDISGVIENRKNHIEADLEMAEKLTKEADDVYDSYQKSLEHAHNGANDAIKQVESQAKSQTETALNDFRTRSDNALKEAEINIESTKIAALASMNQVAVDAAAQAVEKIIGVKADNATIENAVKNINGIKKAKAA